MPHQVVKCSVRGSVGDLAKITRDLEAAGYNILAISASEVNHVGMLAMVFDPDEDVDAIVDDGSQGRSRRESDAGGRRSRARYPRPAARHPGAAPEGGRGIG